MLHKIIEKLISEGKAIEGANGFAINVKDVIKEIKNNSAESIDNEFNKIFGEIFKNEPKEKRTKKMTIQDIIGRMVAEIEADEKQTEVKKDSIEFSADQIKPNKKQTIFEMLEEEKESRLTNKIHKESIAILENAKRAFDAEVIGKNLFDAKKVDIAEKMMIKFIKSNTNAPFLNVYSIQIFKGFGLVLLNGELRYYTRITFDDSTRGMAIYENEEDFIFGVGKYKGLKEIIEQHYFKK